MKKILLVLTGLLISFCMLGQSKNYNQGYIQKRTNGIWGEWEKAPFLTCKLLYNDKKFPTAVEIESQGEQFYIKLKGTYSEDPKDRYLADIEKYEYKKGYWSLNSGLESLFKTRPKGVFVSKVKSKFYIHLVWDDDNGFGFGLYNGNY